MFLVLYWLGENGSEIIHDLISDDILFWLFTNPLKCSYLSNFINLIFTVYNLDTLACVLPIYCSCFIQHEDDYVSNDIVKEQCSCVIY